jgi:hypothetical protein
MPDLRGVVFRDPYELFYLPHGWLLEEDRILAAAVQDATNKKSSAREGVNGRFRHHEDKFNSYNQTVVIWCLRDFLRNGK